MYVPKTKTTSKIINVNYIIHFENSVMVSRENIMNKITISSVISSESYTTTGRTNDSNLTDLNNNYHSNNSLICFTEMNLM